MQIPTKGHVRIKLQKLVWHRVVIGPFAVLMLCQMSASVAAPSPIGVVAPNPEQQGIPFIRREESTSKKLLEESVSETVSILPDQVLPTVIARIDLQSPVLTAEIEALLHSFIGKDRIVGKELEQAQGQIWNLCRQHGRMTRVELRAIPGSEVDGGSTLQARVYEISVRAVKVEQEGDAKLNESLLDDILVRVKADLTEGGVLDLDRLDSRIKRRLFLRDVNLRATLQPVDQNHVDVNVLVSSKSVAPLEFLAQYDNYGMKTYGRNRYIAGLSIPGRVLPGDQIDATVLTADGMNYGRLSYELPLVGLGARMAIWGSYVDYQVPSTSKGNTSQMGIGLIYPLYIDNASVWMGYLNYVTNHQVDRLSSNLITGNKHIDSVEGKVEGSYFPSSNQSLRFNATLIHGKVDLSSLPSALEQDRISAKTDGSFNKLEWGGSWSALLGQGGALDMHLGARGQFASKNLDQSQKLALGGTTGVRAYGPVEALGDEGYIVNAEIGYRPVPWLRTFSFYDLGHTRRNRQPWTGETIPSQYTLRGAGVGLSISHKALVGSVTYARQIGANPGLSANGQDSDGSRGRSRILVSLTLNL